MDLAAEGIGFWDWELKEGKLVISPEWLDMMGYELSDLPDIPKIEFGQFNKIIEIWSQYIHPEDREEAVRTIVDYLIHRTSYNNQFRFRKKNNEYIKIYSNGYGEWDKKGNLVRLRVNHVDVTELGGFDRSILAKFYYMEESIHSQNNAIYKQLNRRLWLAIGVSTIFAFLLLWVAGIFQLMQDSFLLAWVNTQNPISATSIIAQKDIADFTVFYENKGRVVDALARHLSFKADRAIFGYYEPGAKPQWGRIGAQAKRQSVEIELTEEPWRVVGETLVARRDAHLRGEQFLVNNPFADLYDAGFHLSAPGFWVRGDGPTIAWYVAIECEPRRICDEDDIDIKALKRDVEEILNQNNRTTRILN